MQTTVQIKIPAFEGSFTCTVERKEWNAFVETLRHLEASIGNDVEVTWANMEANIEFQYKLKKSGILEGQYKFSPENFSLVPVISGAFEAYQKFLQGLIRSAQQFLENAR